MATMCTVDIYPDLPVLCTEPPPLPFRSSNPIPGEQGYDGGGCYCKIGTLAMVPLVGSGGLAPGT